MLYDIQYLGLRVSTIPEPSANQTIKLSQVITTISYDHPSNHHPFSALFQIDGHAMTIFSHCVGV